MKPGLNYNSVGNLEAILGVFGSAYSCACKSRGNLESDLWCGQWSPLITMQATRGPALKEISSGNIDSGENTYKEVGGRFQAVLLKPDLSFNVETIFPGIRFLILTH